MKIPAALSFLGIVFIILAVIHAYLNISFVTFFGITSPAARKTLGLTLGLLAVSFILSSVSVRIFPGAASQFYYAIAAVWFGTALCLVLASTPVWAVAAAVRWIPLRGLSRLPLYTALFLYGLTALFVIYNVANAHRMRVTRRTVSLKNLPESWRGKTVAHLSDLHLGAYRGRGFLNTVARRTLELRPEIIVITGDLFDGASGGHERFRKGLELLRAPQGVYFISGNHEVYAGLEKTLPAVERAGIKVMDDTMVTLDGLQLIGIASPTMQGPDRPAFDFAALSNFDRNRPSILLYHTPTDINGSSIRPGGPNSPYLSPPHQLSDGHGGRRVAPALRPHPRGTVHPLHLADKEDIRRLPLWPEKDRRFPDLHSQRHGNVGRALSFRLLFRDRPHHPGEGRGSYFLT